MKKLYVKLMTAALAVVILTGCGQKAGYMSALPGQSVVVAKVNVGNLLDESEVLSDNQVKGALKEIINETQGETRTLLREITQDPRTCGIDIDNPVYIAVENIENVRGLVLMAVADEDKLKTSLSTLTNDNDINSMGWTLTTNGDVNTVEDYDGNAIIAFDDEKLVVAFADGIADAMEYMTLSDADQEKCKELEEFINEDADAAFYADYSQLMTLASRASREFDNLDLSMFENAKYIATLNFEKGEAKLGWKFLGNEQFEETYNKMFGAPNNDLLGFLPQGTWALAQVGVKNLACVEDFVQGQLSRELNRMFERANAEFEERGVNAKIGFNLLNSIEGDVVFAVTPVVDNGYREEPQIIFMAECANQNLFNTFINIYQVENENLEKVGNNLYSLGYNKKVDWDNYNWDGNYTYIRKGYDYLFGYADGKMFLMPENLYDKCKSGSGLKEFSSNIKNNTVVYDMIKGNNAGVLDITALVKEIAKVDASDARDIANALDKLENLYLEIKSANEAELVLKTSDKETETLKQLKDICVKQVVRNNSRY